MPNTYQLISSNVFSSSATSFTFSSIPSTFTDLVLKISGRSDQASQPASGLRLTFNGTNTASNTQLQGDGSAVYPASATGGSTQTVGLINGPTTTSNTFSTNDIYIPDYAVTVRKQFATFSFQENNATQAYIDSFGNLQNQTQAITSITITLSSGANMVSGSSFYLYGIKNT